MHGCAQMRLNFASDGVTGVTDWLVVSLYEMVLSNNRAADNDVNAAVDDVRVQD